VHPAAALSAPQVKSVPAPPQAAYQPSAVDFVSPTAGWVLATFASGDYALLRTTDAGQSWTRQLFGPAAGRGTYLRFFDAKDGVFGLTGAHSELFTTTDGGYTWASRGLPDPTAYLLSMSFVDPAHGWLLTRTATPTTTSGQLVRTDDGGLSWTVLGQPVPSPDEPLRAQFGSRTDGWLDSLDSGAYAYHSTDGGATWHPVPLPAPQSGWPTTGQFFVAARPTQGFGVIASVVNFAPTVGRSGVGSTVLFYPPLTVRAFDGGSPVSYIYSTAIDSVAGAGDARNQIWMNATPLDAAPNQVEYSSLDGGSTWSDIAPPTSPGAIGYSDARTWWWIGSGVWSRSSDGGGTWTPFHSVGVITPLPATLQLLDGRHAWFAGMAGTRAVLETTQDAGVHWRMVLLPAQSFT